MYGEVFLFFTNTISMNIRKYNNDKIFFTQNITRTTYLY